MISTMKKVSVNKLAEYLNADSVRRRRIIEDQKSPSDFITIRYKDAREAMIKFITKDFDKSVIKEAIIQLKEKNTISDFQENDSKTSIEALKSFMKIDFNAELLDFKRKKSNRGYKLNIKGIEINVNPDIIITGVFKNKKIVGGIKFNIVKGHMLDNNDRQNVATLIHQVLEEQHDEVPMINFCYSIDVFKQEISTAPKSYKTKRKNIEFACDELSIIWENI
jgi:hypothetical protein